MDRKWYKLFAARSEAVLIGVIDEVFGVQIAAQRIRSVHLLLRSPVSQLTDSGVGVLTLISQEK